MRFGRFGAPLLIGFSMLVLACNALPAGPGASPPTTSPRPQATSPAPSAGSPSPSASPIESPPPSTSPTITPSATSVTSAAQAAALVFQSNPLFNSIKPLSPNEVGQASWYEANDTGDGFTVAVHMGSGDCPSGCINTHTWNYTVSTSGKVKLVDEQGDDVEVSIDHGTGDPAQVTVRLVAGPVCPVEKNPPDPSCAPRPIPDAEVVLRDANGREVGRTHADASGLATFSVPGGAYYAESAAVEGLMGQPGPVAFSVPGGRTVTITMDYDTGIR